MECQRSYSNNVIGAFGCRQNELCGCYEENKRLWLLSCKWMFCNHSSFRICGRCLSSSFSKAMSKVAFCVEFQTKSVERRQFSVVFLLDQRVEKNATKNPTKKWTRREKGKSKFYFCCFEIVFSSCFFSSLVLVYLRVLNTCCQTAVDCTTSCRHFMNENRIHTRTNTKHIDFVTRTCSFWSNPRTEKVTGEKISKTNNNVRPLYDFLVSIVDNTKRYLQTRQNCSHKIITTHLHTHARHGSDDG